MKHGYGFFTWADGKKLKGYWNQNKIIGNGILYCKDGRYYNNFWKDNDQGHYKWPDCSQHEYRCKDDKIDEFEKMHIQIADAINACGKMGNSMGKVF
jgi:hypothetical protein